MHNPSMTRTWTETKRLEWIQRRDTYREAKNLPPLDTLRNSSKHEDLLAYQASLSAERARLRDRLDHTSTKTFAWHVSG
jgi:hypothetical protein